MQMNEISQRQEYRGPVFDKVNAILNIIHGGQIMTDSFAFHGISSCLPEIAKCVPSCPSFRQPTANTPTLRQIFVPKR